MYKLPPVRIGDFTPNSVVELDVKRIVERDGRVLYKWQASVEINGVDGKPCAIFHNINQITASGVHDTPTIPVQDILESARENLLRTGFLRF